MKYLAGFFIRSNFSLTPPSTNDFSLFLTTTFAYMQILGYYELVVKNSRLYQFQANSLNGTSLVMSSRVQKCITISL